MPNSSNANEKRDILIEYLRNPNAKGKKGRIKPLKVLYTETISITDPLKTMAQRIWPGFKNTGTLSVHTLKGNVVGALHHGRSPAAVKRGEFTRSFDFKLTVPGGFFYDTTKTLSFALSHFVEIPFTVPAYDSSRKGYKPHKDTPFFRGTIPDLKGVNFDNYARAIAVIEHPLLTGNERLFVPPQLQAQLLQRLLLQQMGTPSFFCNVADRAIQYTILRMQGVNQARVHKGQGPLNELRLDGFTSAKPYREMVSQNDVNQFREPALVFKLKKFAKECVLTMSLVMGESNAQEYYKSHEGEITARYLDFQADDIQVEGNITVGKGAMHSRGDSEFKGANVETTEDDLDLSANRHVQLLAHENVKDVSKKKFTSHTVTHDKTQIKTAGSFNTAAGVGIVKQGVDAEVGEHMTSTAAQITNAPVLDTVETKKIKKKRSTFKKSKTVTKTTKTEVNSNHYEVGGDMTDDGKQGVIHQATKAEIGGELRVKTDGKYEKTSAKSTDFKSKTRTKSNPALINNKSSGHHHETAHYTDMQAEGGTTVQASKGQVIHVPEKEAPKTAPQDILQAALKAAFQVPSDEEKQTPKTTYVPVHEEHKTWSKSTITVAPAAKIAIAVAITVATLNPGAGVAASAATAAAVTAATHATVSTIENKGDLLKAAKSLATTEVLQEIAISAFAAGAVQGLDSAFASTADAATSSSGQATASSATSSTASTASSSSTAASKAAAQESAKQAAKKTFVQHVGQALKASAVHGGVKAAVTGKLPNAHDLKDILLNGAVNGAAAYGAQNIGDVRADVGSAGHKVLHAGLGATLGLASGGDLDSALAGATGAVVGEIAGEIYKDALGSEAFQEGAPDRDRTIARGEGVAQVAAAFGAGLTGQDANIAAHAGLNAVHNNCFDFDHLDTRRIDEEPTGPNPNPFEPLAEASSTVDGFKSGEEAGRFVGAQVSDDPSVQENFAQAGKVVAPVLGMIDDMSTVGALISGAGTPAAAAKIAGKVAAKEGLKKTVTHGTTRKAEAMRKTAEARKTALEAKAGKPAPSSQTPSTSSSSTASTSSSSSSTAITSQATPVKTHKNSLDYEGETHVYKVIDKDTKQLHKIGESAQGLRKRDGQSKRAEQQARQLNRETGNRYETKVVETFPNKRAARQRETEMILEIRKKKGPEALPGNKNNR